MEEYKEKVRIFVQLKYRFITELILVVGYSKHK